MNSSTNKNWVNSDLDRLGQTVTAVQNLTDEDLHRRLLHLKSKEAQVLALIISHLQEVYRRRLFCDFGCSSIYDYCIRVLRYSNGEAHRKISACRLATQVPEVREFIAKGELSLSNAASVQTLVAKIQKSPHKSREQLSAGSGHDSLTPKSIRSMVERVKDKSSRACEQELHKIAEEFNIDTGTPNPSRRNLDALAQIRISVNRDQLDRLKFELGVHCEQQLIERLISEKLNQLRDERKSGLEVEIRPRLHKQDSKPRSISPSKRAFVIQRARGRCENCGSGTRLEIDHKQSVVLGGRNDLCNLRVLCRSCNQRSAIQQLGMAKVAPYLNGPALSFQRKSLVRPKINF